MREDFGPGEGEMRKQGSVEVGITSEEDGGEVEHILATPKFQPGANQEESSGKKTLGGRGTGKLVSRVTTRGRET